MYTLTDINECNRGVHNCSENAICIDSDGGFSCICEEGYEGGGYNNCTGRLRDVTQFLSCGTKLSNFFLIPEKK